MTSTVAVVTGSNTGIGLETARDFARRGWRVLMTARDPERGRRAVEDVKRTTQNEAVELVVFDLGSLDSIAKGYADIASRTDRVDVLVNNAGAILGERKTTADGFEATFGTNHLGPFLLTHLLVDLLARGARKRIVNVASRAHVRCSGLWFDDLMMQKRRYFAMEAYQHSKLANVSFTVELAKRVAHHGITANALHPGVVHTSFGGDGDMGRLFGAGFRLVSPLLLSPSDGARTTIHCATAPELASVTGRYFSGSKEARPSRAARDEAAAAHLWRISERFVGIR